MIFELIAQFFVEILFGKIILNIFRYVHLLGVFLYKIVTFSRKDVKALNLELKDSSKPLFLGWVVVIILLVLIGKWIWGPLSS